jgi:trigger factor
VKVTTEELERCETLLTLEIEAEQQEKLLKKAAQRVAREVRIPGFRPGKAPYNVIVRRFGIEALQSEALEHSVEDLVKEGMGEVNLTPYAQIQLDSVEWEPALKIKIKVPTKPVIELGDYRSTRLEAKPIEITAEDIEDRLKQLQEQHATWVPVERPAELGDLISMAVTEKEGETVLAERQAVEYELKPVVDEDDEDEDDDEFEDDIDEEDDDEEDEDDNEDEDDEFEDNLEDDDHEDDDEDDDDDEDYAKVKSPRPDLTTPLLGLSAGESKTFSLTYPEDYGNKQYAGKEITFEVEVSGVKVKELDPLDDEFAKQVGDYETLEALKDSIRADIHYSRERANNIELGSEALDKIIENAEKIEWPVTLEEEQIDHEIEHYEQHLKQSSLTLDTALRVQKKTKEELREEMRENVIKQLKRGLAMSKLAELEKLEVSQMEVLEQAKMMADLYGGGDRMWQMLLASEARQNTIANDLLSNKVIQRLGAIAQGKAPEPGAEEAVAEPSATEAGVGEPALLSTEAESAGEVEAPEPAASPLEQTASVENEAEVEAEPTELVPANAAVEVDQTAEESPPANAEDEAESTEPVHTQIQ